MAVAESLGVDPVSAVVQELQQRLYERAQPLVWHTTAQGLAADIAEGELLLTEFPEVGAWQLSVVFHAAPSSDAPGAAPVERGRRVLGWGCPARMQQRALELALRGVPGGPAYRDGPLVWHAIAHDGSRRMAVSSGELRISPLESELCILTHEDGSKVELLSIGTLAELERQAFPMCLTRAGRPLRIRVRGRRVNLRSIDVPGVLGYYELQDGSLIALVLVHGDISLLQVRGAVHRVLARLSWSDLMFGEPIEVRPASQPEQGSARHCSVRSIAGGVGMVDQPFAAEPRDIPGRAFMPEGRVANSRPPRDLETGGPDGAPVQGAPRVLAGEPVLTPANPRPLDVYTPMNDRHRELCRRYFRRLHLRLRGRGARKARVLVLLMLEALDRCREDITGTRLEVYACLERMLAQRLTGGPRNVRDCLDLLMCNSPFARPEPGKRCTLLFGQLHDPDSELMRFILDEDAREEHSANLPAAATDQPAEPRAGETLPAPPQAQQEIPVVEESRRPGEAAPAPEPLPVARATLSAPSNPASPPSPPWEPTLVEVYRLLGREPPTTRDSPLPPPVTTQAPKSSSPGASTLAPSRTGPSSMRGFTSTKTYFLGQLVDDEDESDAPSRYQGHRPLEDPFGSGPFDDLDPLRKKR